MGGTEWYISPVDPIKWITFRREILLSMTYTDAYERTIDAKGRLQIPAQIRELMESAHLGMVLYLVPGRRPGTLSLYPEEQFEIQAQKMEPEPIPNEQLYTYQQMFYSMATRLEMDKQGRVGLPDRILRRAGIDKDVVLTGVGDHLDLWDRAVYEEFVDKNWGRWMEVQREARAASRKVTEDNA